MIKDVPYFRSKQLTSVRALTNKKLNRFILDDAAKFVSFIHNDIGVTVKTTTYQKLSVDNIICELPRNRQDKRTFLVRGEIDPNHIIYWFGFYDNGFVYSDKQMRLFNLTDEQVKDLLNE